MPVEIRVYRRTYLRDPEQARQARLERLLADLLTRGGGRLVLDSREQQDGIDSRTTRRALREHREPSGLTWEHADSTAELLLALPDLAGWCYGAGGEWRKRIEPVLGDVIDLDCP